MYYLERFDVNRWVQVETSYTIPDCACDLAQCISQSDKCTVRVLQNTRKGAGHLYTTTLALYSHGATIYDNR